MGKAKKLVIKPKEELVKLDMDFEQALKISKMIRNCQRRGGSTSPEWWVSINQSGGSTCSGIYTLESSIITPLKSLFISSPFNLE